MLLYKNFWMKSNILKQKLSEELIINKYLSRLNFNKVGTYNFKNDASYVKLNKNRKFVITTDSISENIDFFKDDDPKSIACKIITSNLSDLSSMGAMPYAYSLNLFLPKYVDQVWLRKFTNELYKIQKKYSFYLLGGDLSSSKTLKISSTFFGISKYNKVISQNKVKSNQDIWITGNLGDSYVGLQIIKKKIDVKVSKIKNYFINKYYYPKPCMIGSELSRHVTSMIDISDGFVGDLKKMLNNKYGAMIDFNSLPVSLNTKKLLNRKIFKKKYIFNTGDNYELIIVSNKEKRNKILKIAKKNKIKISLVGKISNKFGISDDSNNTLDIPKEFDHFR